MQVRAKDILSYILEIGLFFGAAVVIAMGIINFR
jgi:hypothetical protein